MAWSDEARQAALAARQNKGGGKSELQQAASNFMAAHQNGVNEAAPSQSGRDLYAAAMSEAKRQHANDKDYGETKYLRDMEPDIDEDPDNDPWSGTGRYAR